MSTVLSVMLIVVFVLFVMIMVSMLIRRNNMYYGSGCGGCGSGCGCDSIEDEVVTTTVTTSTVTENAPGNDYVIEGVLARSFENGQPYVLDPADGVKFFVNATDDMYEDANGRIWELR